MAIDLPAFHENKPSAKHLVELPYPLSDDLEKYVAFYNEFYKAHVPAAELIREIIRLHLDRDQSFREKKAASILPGRGRTRNKAGAASAATPANHALASSSAG